MPESAPSHQGAQSSRRISNRRLTQVTVAAVALIYGIIFVVLNRGKVRIHFVFFTVTSRLWVGFVVCLVLGALLGQAVGLSYRRRRSAKAGDSSASAR